MAGATSLAAAAYLAAAGKSGVRVVVIGDPGTGKSSLIVTLATEQFPESVSRVMPPTSLPADYFSDRVPVTIIDTSSSPEQKPELIAECQAADAVMLTYACDRPATLERLSSFWLPELRRLQLKAPITVVGCKLDLRDEQEEFNLEQVMAPITQSFREIETCIECSALRQIQVTEVFYYAQKAVLHPIAPLFDQELESLKPQCVRALERIFIICDTDKDGALSDVELNEFQVRCFSESLQHNEISGIKRVVQEKMPEGVNESGLTLNGFLFLHALFIEKGRLETTWTVLRKFGYNNDLKLRDDLLAMPIKRAHDQGTSVALGDTNSEVVQTSQGPCIETVREDSGYMELNILERIVNESEEPGPLDFALLHSITENFSEKKKIGSGGCGIVYKGILRNGIVAVKRLHSSRTIKDKMFHREVINLISVKHPNIVRFLGYCSFTKEHAVPFGGTIIMADIRERLLCFEYIRNGSLDQHLSDELRGLKWQTRYQIIIGICRGLHYLHKDKGIIHMDLKPGNILLDDLMVPKITDFGLSRPEIDSQDTTTCLISQGYVAPEYILRGKATRKSDIYSLGVIIIELVTGSRTKPNITKVLRKWNHRWIKSMKQSSLAYQQVAKCLELALRCIQDVPTDRPDISDIIDELNKIDTTDGQTQIQISPCCLVDILGIEPLEIRIPIEDLKISYSIELTNDTDDYFAFATKAKLERFCTEPDKGIIPPRSKCSVTLAMEAQVNAQPNKHYTEVITVLSSRVTAGDIFIDSKEGKVVDEVDVLVVFGKPEEE